MKIERRGVTPSPLIRRGYPAECKADGAKVSARIVQRVRNEWSEARWSFTP